MIFITGKGELKAHYEKRWKTLCEDPEHGRGKRISNRIKVVFLWLAH